MRNLGPRSEAIVASAILAVGAAVVATMHLTWPAPEDPVVTYAISNGQQGVEELRPFEITDVSGEPVELRPGTQGQRHVRLSNPNSVDIVVQSLSALPGQPVDGAHNRVAECPSGVLSVTPMTDPVLLAPNGSVEVTMVVEVSTDVPAACTDLVFPLTYSGRAARI
ncbi:hypothetical protein [Umezawaea beigongshangensis]|uniref:hypothetical protein n=1 Tax=Umezawaea beigongshangensis TaxID=2780383 RepID=UPI0018F1E6DC|nr:hypothetical protein [Umezawaea beigongshangensis]